MLMFVFVLMTATCLLTAVETRTPIGTGGPSHINEGRDALLTCVVSENYNNNTVIWKKSNEILTAGRVRVTTDQRINVLHDENPEERLRSDGEVWVLLIKNLTITDTGTYICELNSNPILRSIHILTVTSGKRRNFKDQQDNGCKNCTITSRNNYNDDSDEMYLAPPPPLEAQDNASYWPTDEAAPRLTHDFSACCQTANVSQGCLGFCNIHNILDGTAGVEPDVCEKDFPQIVRCMADGRNHVPCCVQKQIPDLCQDMCRGEYIPFTDMLRTRVSCEQHTLSALQCILKGVHEIPGPPVNVFVDNVTETSALISWSPPEKLAHLVNHYIINMTALHSFDENFNDNLRDEQNDMLEDTNSMKRKETNKNIVYQVPANVTNWLATNLKPLTMYAIVVIAANDYSSSLPAERLRIFTHLSDWRHENETDATSLTTANNLPDIRGCCEAKGMRHRMCLDKMCDPQKTDLARLPDFMVCAPWSNITFSCLTNNMDHTPCCQVRGIPSICYPLCSGKIQTLNFSLFKCLRFMSEFSSCLFQGYGVLADPPSKIRLLTIADRFVILDWSKPKRLADTVITYHIKFRLLSIDYVDYKTVEKKRPPLILEGLQPNEYYEFYVVSVNAYGQSEASTRIITHTHPLANADNMSMDDINSNTKRYNITKCCLASGLLPLCSPLCTYNIRLSDIERLGTMCRTQMSVVIRCAAGGRDHTPCCARRGVSTACMSLCRGVLPIQHTTNTSTTSYDGSLAGYTAGPTATVATSSTTTTSSTNTFSNKCLSYAGNILQCFEEGTESIPEPAEDVHTTFVTNTSIGLAWSQAGLTIFDQTNNTAMMVETESGTESGIESEQSTMMNNTAIIQETNNEPIEFIIQYGKVNNMTMYETIAKAENELITNRTSIDLLNLEPHALYRITVLTRGKYGVSLPASMLLINTTELVNDWNPTDSSDMVYYAAPSPPHSLTILAHSVTWLQLIWQPPEYSHPHESITYRVYHKPMKAEKFATIETKVAWLRINSLKPSSQHILYVEAIGEKATSLPSETLVAWTDPAISAFVNPPIVHPSNNIPEGGSMTILCVALGNPIPTMSLYVGGHLVRQVTTRQMVTVIHNVTVDMEQVVCYADNGYGQAMQTTQHVNICYAPRMQAAGITVASIGDEVELRCMIDSKPASNISFWRDYLSQRPVQQGGNYDISIRINDTHPTLQTMVLRINKLQANDVGDYFCHAENLYGSAMIPVSVRIRNTASLTYNAFACCSQLNVSDVCRSACTHYIDIDAIADRTECISEFDKLMRCAADGSDHRSCCAENNVPRKCLNWCRGEPINTNDICGLQYVRTIIGCFEKNRDRLPGPPENLTIRLIDDHTVLLTWNPPTKNPNAVDVYRIYYREVQREDDDITKQDNSALGNRTARVNHIPLNDALTRDVGVTAANITKLEPDTLYEVTMKAANNFGASISTNPIRFTLDDYQLKSASMATSSNIGSISGIIAGGLALLLATIFIICYMKYRQRNINRKANASITFENPTYTRSLEQVQLPTTANHGNDTTADNRMTASSTTADPMNATKSTSHDNIDSKEVKPTIYEEIKLGHDGSGFKKLVP